MAEQNAEILEILIRQVGQDADVNSVLGKTLGVFGHAERGQPVCDRGHHLPPLGVCAMQA